MKVSRCTLLCSRSKHGGIAPRLKSIQISDSVAHIGGIGDGFLLSLPLLGCEKTQTSPDVGVFLKKAL